jgi:hypothetical protein
MARSGWDASRPLSPSACVTGKKKETGHTNERDPLGSERKEVVGLRVDMGR